MSRPPPVPSGPDGATVASTVDLAHPGTDAGGAIAASFRDTVSLPAPPRGVRARISADVIYRLWVNRRLAARGPADPGNDFTRPGRAGRTSGSTT